MANAITLTLDGTAAVAHAVRVQLALGEPFAIDVELDDDAALPSALAGAPFELVLRSQVGDSLTLTGVVAEARRTHERGAARTDLSLVPAAWALDLGRDTRLFVEKSPADVVASVLSAASIDHRAGSWGATKRPTIAQRDESDLAFIERLLAEEGASYWFEPGAPTKLVLWDPSTAPEEIPGEPLKSVAGAIGARGAHVSELRVLSERVPTGVRLLAHRLDQPATKLDAVAGKADAQLFDFRLPFDDASSGKQRAQRRLDALAAESVVLAGETNSAALVPGMSFGITGAALDDVSAEWLCISIELSAVAEEPLRATFRAVPAATPHRLLPRARPTVGLERAKVVGPSGQEIHVDDKSHVRVKRWWDRLGPDDQNASSPTLVAQWFLAKSMAYPRVGWDVALAHVSGDPDRPVVLGALHDGAHPVPYALPSKGTVSALQTATSPSDGTFTEFFFDDHKGQEELRLHAAKDLEVEIGDARTGLLGGGDTAHVTKDRTVKIGKDRKLSISEDLEVEIDGKETIEHGGSRSDTVKGKEERKTSGDRAISVAKASSVDVGGARKLQVGGKLSAKASGDVQRTISGAAKATVAAATTITAEEGIERLVGGKLQELVGGASMTQGKGVTLVVKGDAQQTVGAAVAMVAKDVVESAGKKLTLTVGGALMATAPSIEIVADSKIEIVVGGATLTISSSGVEIAAPLIGGAAPLIAESGAMVKHNP